jgi:hypothetical protein
MAIDYTRFSVLALISYTHAVKIQRSGFDKQKKEVIPRLAVTSHVSDRLLVCIAGGFLSGGPGDVIYVLTWFDIPETCS